MQKEKTTWFASWFNTSYYHILYKHRNYDEAARFMNNLTAYLKLPQGASILDLACGKGRHSIYLSKLGYHVTGIDLSPESIAFANKYKNHSLHFEVHDMRNFYNKKFDAVFNLFTSFGYFETEEENRATIRSIKNSLKSNGVGVIDFLNTEYVINNLVPEETKIIEGITFYLKRYVKDNFICKDITFTDNGETFTFTERVRALTLTHFKTYFKESNCTLLHYFGDYNLTKYDAKTSKRLILLFK